MEQIISHIIVPQLQSTYHSSLPSLPYILLEIQLCITWMECNLHVSRSSLKSFPRLESDHIINWVNNFNYKRKSIKMVFTKLKVWSLDIVIFSGYASSHFPCFTCYLQHSTPQATKYQQAKVDHNWMQHHSNFTGKMLMHRKVVNTLVKIKTVSTSR